MIATKKGPYKQDGIWNYPELPSGMRKAALIDFSILSDELIFGINILHKPDALHDYQAQNITGAPALDAWTAEILAGNVYVDKMPYKQFGLWFYPRFPLGCRRALLSDFFTTDLELKTGINFLVLGSVNTEYEAHCTSTADRFATWLEWIPAGRVFIKSN